MSRTRKGRYFKWGIVIVALACLVVLSLPGLAQGGEHLSLFLPSFNQAYQDAAGIWGSCQMGTGGCSDRISTDGCLITCFAMILDYYGVDLFIPAASSCTGSARAGMDPGILNDWLRTHGGYGRCPQDAIGNCCLEWSNLPSHIFLSFHENQGEAGVDFASQQIINQALAAGYPVVSGVHWGSHCHGNTGKAEDCHWVVITGKLGATYTIVDPYNREVTSRYGVRTTLTRGVLGSYTVDRFVVVSGLVPATSLASPHLEVSFEPQKDWYYKGELQRRMIYISGCSSEFFLYVRVIDPQGKIYYAYYPTPDPGPTDLLRYSKERHSLYEEPRRFMDGEWEWSRTVLTDEEPGTWTWEIWLEDPTRPSEPLAYDISAYTIAGAETTAMPQLTSGLAAVGLALLFTVLVYVLVLANNGR